MNKTREITNIKPEKKQNWTEKFKESLIIQILNLKSQPELLKKVLEYSIQVEVNNVNIKMLTEWILFKINLCKIVELADLMAYIANIKNEQEKVE